MRTYEGALVTADTFFSIPARYEHGNATFFFCTRTGRPTAIFKSIVCTNRQVIAFQGIDRNSKISKELKARGITVKDTGNISSGSYEGNIRIVTGPTGVNVAYTLARAFEDAEIIMDPRPTPDVTVTIGSQYSDMVSLEKFKEIASKDLEKIDGCKLVQIA